MCCGGSGCASPSARRSRPGGRARADDPRPAKPDPVAVGYEIFNREWLPNDPRSHGGDGLGPVYNDTSCVACHNSGGSGGAGPVSKNIDILSASRHHRAGCTDDARTDVRPSVAPTVEAVPVVGDTTLGRFPRRVPDQPDGRPAQVRHRPELRCVAAPGPSGRPRSPACRCRRPRSDRRRSRRRSSRELVGVRSTRRTGEKVAARRRVHGRDRRRWRGSRGHGRRCSRAIAADRQPIGWRSARSSSSGRSATRRRCSASG